MGTKEQLLEEFISQTKFDVGLIDPSENPQEVEDEEVQKRIQILNNFLDNLSPIEMDGFLFKLTEDLPAVRRSLVIRILKIGTAQYTGV